MKKNSLAVSIIFLFFVLASTWAIADDSQFVRVKGDIAGVNYVDQTVIVSTDEGFVTVRVDGTTSLFRSKQPTIFTELQIGDRIDVRYEEATMTAVSVNLTAPIVQGFITSKGEQILPPTSITVTPKGRKPITFKLTAYTKITRNLKPATWKELQVGDFAKVTYEAKTMNAISVAAMSYLRDELGGMSILKGFIQGLKWTGSAQAPLQMTVQAPVGKAMLFIVNSQTAIDINGVTAGPKDLLVGDLVEVHFQGSNIALKVSVQRALPPPTVMNCVLEEIKFTGSNYVFVMESVTGPYYEYEMIVTSTSKLMRNGKPATPAQFQAGDYGKVTFQPRDMKIIQFIATSRR